MKDKDTQLLQEQYKKLFEQEEIDEEFSFFVASIISMMYEEFWECISEGLNDPTDHFQYENLAEQALIQWYEAIKNNNLSNKEKIHQILYKEDNEFRWAVMEDIARDVSDPDDIEIYHDQPMYVVYNLTEFITEEHATKLIEEFNRNIETNYL